MENIIWFFTSEEVEQLRQGKTITKNKVINPYFRGGKTYIVDNFTVTCEERYAPFNFKKSCTNQS